MTSRSPQAIRTASPSSDASTGPTAPIAFLRRVAEHAGASPILFPALDPGTSAWRVGSWQQVVEGHFSSQGLVTRRVIWSVREAFGAATRGCPLVSIRDRSPQAPEFFSFTERARSRVLVAYEDSGAELHDLASIGDWLGDPDLDSPRSWIVVENRSTSSSGDPADHDPDEHEAHHGPTPFARLVQMVRTERADLWAIVLFAAAIGGLTLATPIAVQQLVNSIAFGGLVQPVVVLALLLFAVLAFSAVVSAVQAFVSEVIQRRLFIRVVADVAERLPRAQSRAFDRHHGPELVNRIFEVVTVQKVGSMLLIEGTALLLQTVVGLVVLSFYHPLMLGFSGFLIAGILFVVVWMGRGAVSSAIKESKAKYEVFGWLEELARHPSTFRDDWQRVYARTRADGLATAWLFERGAHFKIVLRQTVGALALQVVGSSALLALGGMLIVRGQLTLGQLVASELILTVIVSNVAKLGKQLERFYDLMAAIDKLSILIDLPLERGNGVDLVASDRPASIAMVDVQFGFDAHPIFSNLSLRIEAGEHLALEGAMGSGKSSFLDLLFGLREPSSGYITLDAQDYRDVSMDSLRDSVALVRGAEMFSGTIRENVRVGRRNFDDEEMLRVLDAVGILDEIRALPRGLETRVSTDARPLSQVQISRLMLARAILSRPRLLLVDRALDDLDENARERICALLFDPGAPWTLVVVSERADVLGRCTRRWTLGNPETWATTSDVPGKST